MAAKKIEMKQQDLDLVTGCMSRTWGQICFDMEPTTDNEIAVEVVLDADYMETYAGPNGRQAKQLVSTLIDEHGYKKVLKFFSKKISLV